VAHVSLPLSILSPRTGNSQSLHSMDFRLHLHMLNLGRFHLNRSQQPGSTVFRLPKNQECAAPRRDVFLVDKRPQFGCKDDALHANDTSRIPRARLLVPFSDQNTSSPCAAHFVFGSEKPYFQVVAICSGWKRPRV